MSHSFKQFGFPMLSRVAHAALRAIAAALACCFAGTGASALDFSLVVKDLDQPVDVAFPDDASERMFIVEKGGLIKIYSGGKIFAGPYLDVREKVSTQMEQGLLGMAFHPDFKENRKLFVYYTDKVGDSVLARYQTELANPNVVSIDSEKILLRVRQPFANHNGGCIRFGPDGFLYIGLGDGGGSGDPNLAAQNLGSLLGKILRLDVDGPEAVGLSYAIPADNPFMGKAGARKEIWAYGFRNPWRFSFDAQTGRLFAGDVGQDTTEEIDIVSAGKNYGWNWLEGTKCFRDNCSRRGIEMPIAEYGRNEGVSVTGGFVYRGRRLPLLEGSYIFGDFGSGTLWSLTYQNAKFWKRDRLKDTDFQISSFGEDRHRELYVVDFRGNVYRIDP